MIINFNDMKEITISGMNNGTGEMSAKMFIDEGMKIIPCRIRAGGLIGLHSHPTSDDINCIVSGSGKAICDDEVEMLSYL